MLGITRRQFITLLGGIAAWPLAARGQQRALPVIGFPNGLSPDGFADRLRAFHQGLKDAGFAEGENVTVEYRWSDGQFDRLPTLAAELVRRQVNVIAAPGGANLALAAQSATRAVPIVFMVAEDPVKLGLVASLARPGGNLTGVNVFNDEIVAKRLEILCRLVPNAARVAVLINPSDPDQMDTVVRDLEAAARVIGLQIMVLKASTSAQIDAAFATLERERPDALFVTGDTLFTGRRFQLVNLASYHHLPATYSTRSFPDVGGLMSYGSNVTDAYRQVGSYTGRILKGEKPVNLPVVQPTKFELVINNQAARILGVTVPPMLLAIADEIIE